MSDLGVLFRTWFGIGAQSFGGGAATLTMIRRAAVEQHAWMTDGEFTRYWGICQIAPGINILGITILIGWRVGQAMGALAALLGLLLPSATLTILLTAAYASIRDLPAVQSAVRGVIPATCGLGLLLAWRMARPPLEESRREGSASLGVSIAAVFGSALLVGVVGAPVIGVLWGCGGVVALLTWLQRRGVR
jgi:chromate transporter